MLRTPAEVLVERIRARSVADGDCLIWTGATNGEGVRHGYGLISATAEDGKPVRLMTHRVMYEHEVGPIPEGLVIDHDCRRHACVNTAHMEPVTRPENTRRGMPYWTLNTVCRNNHEYTEENTYTPPGQPLRRQCRECRMEADRRRRQEQP